MPVHSRCPSCAKQLQVPDDLLGRLVQCPSCGSTFTASDDLAHPRAEPRREIRPEEIREGPPARWADDDRTEVERVPPRGRAADDWDDDVDDRGRYPRRPRAGRDYDEDYRRPRRRGLGLQGLSNQYTIDVGAWFNFAKEHYSAAFGPMIGFLMIHVLIATVEGIPAVGLLIWTAMLFIHPALQAGFAIVALAQLRGRPWNFGDFFAGFNWYGSLLGNFWLTVAIGLACIFPGLILVAIAAALVEIAHAPEMWALAYAGGVVSLGLSIYIFVRTTFFSVALIVDRDCGPVEAIQGSWQLSRGHFWGLFGMSLLLALIVLAGLLACLVGALFAVPFVVLAQNAGYLLITDRATLRRLAPYPVEPYAEYDDERRS